MNKMKILCFALIAVFSVTACGKKEVFKGNIVADDTYYDMTFDWLNTAYTYDMYLEQGDSIEIFLEKEKGKTRLTALNSRDSAEWILSPAVDNLINRNFSAFKPNEKWLTDITEFAIPAGKVYLSPIVDCFDGLLVNSMLDDAAKLLSVGEKPIIHSDRGVHYRWPGWIDRMEKNGFIRSMSKKGCSPDNSACEGVFGRIKNEMFYNADWSGVNISEFIGILNDYLYWYNEKRIKKSLGYLSPIEYRHRLGLVT